MRAGSGYDAAMTEFGVLSGMTMPMLMLPSAFLSPLITVLSPRFSAGKVLEDQAMIRRKDRKSASCRGIDWNSVYGNSDPYRFPVGGGSLS